MTPPASHRLAVAAALSIVSGAYVAWYMRVPGAFSDFNQLWVAARALLAGRDPYGAVRAAGLPWPLYYPMPAVLVAIPFSALALPAARIVFGALSGGAFAYAMTGRGWWGLVALASFPFLNVLEQGQWSALLTAALALPALATLWPAKPTIALALAGAGWPWRERSWRWGAIGAALLVSLSFVLLPSWPIEWREALRGAVHLRPLITRPGGFLVLLAALRWRRPEARLLVGLALVPQTLTYYEVLPLALVARNLREMLAFSLLSVAAVVLNVSLLPGNDPVEHVTRAWPFLLALLYLPATIAVLRRPNEVPAGDGMGPTAARSSTRR